MFSLYTGTRILPIHSYNIGILHTNERLQNVGKIPNKRIEHWYRQRISSVCIQVVKGHIFSLRDSAKYYMWWW